MSYLVLARKYRPQTFADVVGQEHVTRTLANAFAAGRVHHAFLFCGPRGCGKTTTARILGKALNCERGAGAEPCGQCDACTTIAAGTSVDYHEMDGASNRGIDAIRELTEAVRYQPAALRKKVYVIDEVHMLTTEAFNALLKTLEEPPPHVTFVLATTEPHKIPSTILSRCQRYDFKLVASSRLAAHLRDVFAREGLAAEGGAIDLIVREAGGSVRDALSLSDQVISFVGHEAIREAQVAEVLGVADRALTRALIEALARGDAGAALGTTDQAVGRGLDEVQIARALVRTLRDLAVLQVAPGQLQLVEGSDEEKQALVEQAAAIDRGRVRLMFDRMLQACEELAETHESRMVLDLALIDLAAIEPLVPLGDLLDRLGQLERRLGSAPAAPRGSPTGGSGRQTSAVAPAAAAPVHTPVERTQAVNPDRPSPIPSPSPYSNPSPYSSPIPAPSPYSSPTPAPTQRSGSAPASSTGTGSGSASVAVRGTPPRGTPADPLQAWAGVVIALEQAGEVYLSTVYEGAKVLSFTDGPTGAAVIAIGYPATAVMGEQAADPSKIAVLVPIAAAHLGRAVEISVKLLAEADLAAAPTAVSLIEAEAEQRRIEREKRQSEARAHPLTQAVLATFGGSQIKEIKTDV